MLGGATCFGGGGGLHALRGAGGYMLGRGGGYMLGRGGVTCLAEGGLHAWQREATCLAEGGGGVATCLAGGGGGYMLDKGGDYMLGRGGDYILGRGGGDTCLAKEGGITLAVQCRSSQSYIEDNPVKMIFCCAVVQMQMIIFSSTHTILCIKSRVIKNPLSLLSSPSYSCKYTNLDLQE